MKPWLKSTSIAFLFLLTFDFVQAQIFELGCFIEQRYPCFNADKIREMKIESITLRLMRKPSSRPIYDDGKRVTYHFDQEGRLISFQKVFPGKFGVKDTTSLTYIYRGDELKATSQKMGSYRKRWSYEKQGDSEVIEVTKVKRGSMDWDTLKVEQIRYEQHATQKGHVVVELRGGVGTDPYERLATTSDMTGRLLTRERWLGPRAIELETWLYENQFLKSYMYQRPQSEKELVVHYSVENELQDSGRWCEEGTCQEWSIVYFSNGLPKGWIVMDPTTQDMEIWEYRYTYR